MTHPPIANRTVCVDFDGTIVPWGPLMGDKDPFPGVAEAMQGLKAMGYSIVIFTSRLSDLWLIHEGHDPEEQYEFVAMTLRAHDIPYDRITAEKVPAEAYFDDRAIQVSTWNPLAQAIDQFLEERDAEEAV